MRLHRPALSHPKHWPRWAGPLVVPYPMYWARLSFPFAGYSGLWWTTPDERRLPDTPCFDASTANDRSHHPPFRFLLSKYDVCPTQLMTSMTPLGPTVLHARKAKRRSWQATRRYAWIIARPPAVGSPRPPLQRVFRRLRFARHRLRVRPA